MTNVPGMGFAIILLGGISVLVLFASVLIGLAASRFIEEYDFLQLLLASYLGTGALAALAVVVAHGSGPGSAASILIVGAVAYIISSLFVAGVPFLIGGGILKWRYNTSWDAGIKYSSTGWVIGAAIAVILGLFTNFILLLLAPLTSFLGATVGGVLYVEYFSED